MVCKSADSHKCTLTQASGDVVIRGTLFLSSIYGFYGSYQLTHCGLVKRYGDIDMEQHWLRPGLFRCDI